MMKHLGLLALLISTSLLRAETAPPKNKLLEMFRFFYLPFKIEFVQGDTKDEIVPLDGVTVLAPEEMAKLDKAWTDTRSSWKNKSVFKDIKVPLNSTQKISSHLFSHHIAANRGALESIGIEERIRLNELLKGKPAEVKASVLQKQFVRSFIEPETASKPHFFIVAPDWCASSENYRTVFEHYAKKLALGSFVLHSIIIDDPEEKIFDSKAMTELFPTPKAYSHESVPRFLMTELKDGELVIYEEAAALEKLYDSFFYPHKGFLAEKTPEKPALSKLSLR